MGPIQRWRRLGHVHVSAGEGPWEASHASYPTPISLPDGRLRVFFSPRDQDGRSSIFSLDLVVSDQEFRPLGPPQGPWLEPGPRGAFDDGGASVSCILPTPEGELTCYYLGWNPGVSVPFRNAIGLAHAPAGATRFTRASPAPLLDRSAEDPFVMGYPWVVKGEHGLTMWYGTHLSWGEGWMEMDHVIRRATSSDGQAWARDAKPCLLPAGGEEFALSRPCVLREADGAWHMWYCRRYAQYRPGYATSRDGLTWHRDDSALHFIGDSPDWENGVQTYPSVIDHQGRRYMFYNGAGYGRTGFGLAVLEAD